MPIRSAFFQVVVSPELDVNIPAPRTAMDMGEVTCLSGTYSGSGSGLFFFISPVGSAQTLISDGPGSRPV